MLIDEGNHALTRHLKSMAQRRLAESHDIHFQVYDDYTFYCNWREHRSRAIPLGVPLGRPTFVAVPTDAALPVRRRTRERVNRHAVRTDGGQYITVSRLVTNSYFDHMHSRPIYACADYIDQRLLKGVVETERGANWFTVVGHESSSSCHAAHRLAELNRRKRAAPNWFTVVGHEGVGVRISFLYKIWTGFIEFFARLVTTIERVDHASSSEPLEVRLDFSEVELAGSAATLAEDDGTVDPTTTVEREKRIVDIKFPKSFLRAFRRPANDGERIIVRSMAVGLLMLRPASSVDADVADAIVHDVIPHDGTRILHLFEVHPFDHLLADDMQEVDIRTLDDVGFVAPGLAVGCYDSESGRTLASKPACGEFLHRLVDKIYGQLSTKLRELDRAFLIRRVYRIHDAVVQDREHWKRTSLALHAIHGADASVADVARERESMRSKLAVSARCLLELAICECPAEGGRRPSQWDVDGLLAHAELMIQAATDSDAIHHDLVQPQITIHPNGEYDAERSFFRDVIAPFAAGYFDEKFRKDMESYHGYYTYGRKNTGQRSPARFSEEFNQAFIAEYGLKPDDAISGFAEIMDIVMERKSAVVEVKMGELRTRLTKRRELSGPVVGAFIRTIAIFHRSSWQSVPNRVRTQRLVSVAVSQEAVFDCEAIAGIWNGGGRHGDTGCRDPKDGLVVPSGKG